MTRYDYIQETEDEAISTVPEYKCNQSQEKYFTRSTLKRTKRLLYNPTNSNVFYRTRFVLPVFLNHFYGTNANTWNDVILLIQLAKQRYSHDIVIRLMNHYLSFFKLQVCEFCNKLYDHIQKNIQSRRFDLSLRIYLVVMESWVIQMASIPLIHLSNVPSMMIRKLNSVTPHSTCLMLNIVTMIVYHVVLCDIFPFLYNNYDIQSNIRESITQFITIFPTSFNKIKKERDMLLEEESIVRNGHVQKENEFVTLCEKTNFFYEYFKSIETWYPKEVKPIWSQETWKSILMKMFEAESRKIELQCLEEKLRIIALKDTTQLALQKIQLRKKETERIHSDTKGLFVFAKEIVSLYCYDLETKETNDQAILNTLNTIDFSLDN